MEAYQNKRRIYSVFGEELVSEEGIKYRAYGIRVEENEGSSFLIADVTDDRKELERVVGHCNDGELDVIHIYDIVEDLLLR